MGWFQLDNCLILNIKDMALLLKKFFLRKEYDDVYVDIDVLNINTQGTKSEVFLNYWLDSEKKEKIYGDHYQLDFDKKSDLNAYTQAYNELKKLSAFTEAIDN